MEIGTDTPIKAQVTPGGRMEEKNNQIGLLVNGDKKICLRLGSGKEENPPKHL